MASHGFWRWFRAPPGAWGWFGWQLQPGSPKCRGFGVLPCPQQVVSVFPPLVCSALGCPGVPGLQPWVAPLSPACPNTPVQMLQHPNSPQNGAKLLFLPLLRSRSVNFMHLGHCLAAPALEAGLKWSLDLVVALEMIKPRH